MAHAHLHLSGDPEADAVLSRDPLALLIGMVLDQQIPLEKAFSSPAELARRLGAPDSPPSSPPWTPTSSPHSSRSARRCTAFPDRWRAGCRPCRTVAEDYANSAENVWKGAKRPRPRRAGEGAPPVSANRRRRSSWRCSASNWACGPRAGAPRRAPTASRGRRCSVADITDAESDGQGARQDEARRAKARASASTARAGRLRPTPLPLHAGPARPRRFVTSCVAGGVDVVQLRDKHLDARAMLERAAVVAARSAVSPPTCRSSSTTARIWRSPSGPTGSTWDKTTPVALSPAHRRCRRHRGSLHPRADRPGRGGRRGRHVPLRRTGRRDADEAWPCRHGPQATWARPPRARTVPSS